jgi:hypothetical protein
MTDPVRLDPFQRIVNVNWNEFVRFQCLHQPTGGFFVSEDSVFHFTIEVNGRSLFAFDHGTGSLTFTLFADDLRALYPQAFEQQLPYIDLVWSWPFDGEFIGTLVTHLWYRPVATRNGADVELFPLAMTEIEGGTSAVLRLQLNPPNRWRGDWL